MSHHSLGAFFSGQDIKTLNIEGDDTNCFVSLIVDTKGTYQAAITRKVQSKIEVTTKSLGKSYEFFGEGSIVTEEDPMSETTQVVDKEVIEYFMLDVQREVVNNPLEYLDKRFDEIEKSKEIYKKPLSSPDNLWKLDTYKNNKPLDWNYCSKTTTELPLFSDVEVEETDNLESLDFAPDPNTIHEMVVRMVMCSLAFKVDSKFDFKQWITRHMDKVYSNIFLTQDSFRAWCDFIVEYSVENYSDTSDSSQYLSLDELYMLVADAMINELTPFKSNKYINEYCKSLHYYLE